MWKFPLYIFSTGSFLNVHMSWHDSSHDLVSLLRSPNILAKQTRKDYEQNGSTFDELVSFFKFNIYTSMIHEVPNSKVQLGSTLWCPLCEQTFWLISLISWCRWWLFLGSTTFCQRWAEVAENRNGEFLINQPSFVSCFCFSGIMISLFNLSLFILCIVAAASELVSIWYFMCGLRVMHERSIFAVYVFRCRIFISHI